MSYATHRSLKASGIGPADGYLGRDEPQGPFDHSGGQIGERAHRPWWMVRGGPQTQEWQ
jgi:hypothetical protein